MLSQARFNLDRESPSPRIDASLDRLSPPVLSRGVRRTQCGAAGCDSLFGPSRIRRKVVFRVGARCYAPAPPGTLAFRQGQIG